MTETQDPNLVRRLTGTLFAAQSLATVGITVASTVGTIVTQQMTGNPALAGIPSTLFLLGNAFGAYPAGRLMDRFGRRPGLELGFVLALAGASLAALAVPINSFLWLLLGFLLMGLGRGATDQGRFAAADMVTPERRGRAVSWVVLGGTVGGILGPLFVGPTSRLAVQLQMQELVGPFIAIAVLMALGWLVVFLTLRPDPLEIARRLGIRSGATAAAGELRRSFRDIMQLSSVQLAMAAMVFGQIVMIVVMVITPLHMTIHHQDLNAVSIVIAAHVFGMYGLSLLTGRVADAYGRGTGIMLGTVILSTACALAPLVDSPLLLAPTLFLLGLGWNFCYVSGSSLLADALRPGERGQIQGTNDLVVGLTSAVGSLGSGVLFATIGFGGIALAGIAIALGLLVSSIVLTRQLFGRAAAG